MAILDRPPAVNRDFGSVRVYALTPAEAIHRSAAVIAREVFGMKGLQDEGRILSVHPASGYLFYSNSGEIWQDRRGALPPQKDVERLARAFLEEANRRIAGSQVLRRSLVGPLFPSDIRRTRVAGVVPKGGRRPDHWLCQFAAFLPVDGRKTARVEGSLVDVRIGRKGRVVGLSSRWRPIRGESLSDERDRESREHAVHADGSGSIRPPRPAARPAIAKPAPAVEAPGKEPASAPPGHHAPVEYVYWLADENAPQTFLSPMYLEQGGEHRSVRAAAAHTLTAVIFQRTVGTRLECIAVVSGGSGAYEYRWSYWTPGDFEKGITVLGSFQTVALDRGAYQMLLGVTDRITGAVLQTEKAVYPRE